MTADLLRFLSLQDHNTRVVLLGASVFGAAAGLVGTFLLMRKRSLLGDTLGHATLPGVAGAFLIAHALGMAGKSLPWLLAGALVSGLAGMAAVLAIRKFSRIKDDAALAIVLSVFFGFGVTLLTAIQQLPAGNAAGLDHFIYGKTASMTSEDATFILLASLVIGAACTALFKEFALLCFDEGFAAASGWPVRRLDGLLMGLVALITVVGLQAVGLLLVVALLVIPPAAARFWTERLPVLAAGSAGVGCASAFGGVAASAVLPGLPTGAVIVLVAAAFFVVSLIFGTSRGVLAIRRDENESRRRLRREHLLRAVYECQETGLASRAALLAKRPWPVRELDAELRRSTAQGLLSGGGEDIRLTAAGRAEARRIVRNHRLWELYLLNHADVAPARVDRDADLIEHVLDPVLVEELEEMLDKGNRAAFVPENPEASWTGRS